MARGGISRQKPPRDKTNKTGGHSYHGGKGSRDSAARGGRGGRRGGDGRRNASRHMDSGNEDGSVGHLLTPSSYRGQVDPETLSYFSEIFALIGEGGSVVDPSEKAALAVNALEETRGKELPLACHAGCSRVLENILVSCDVVHTLSFLNNCLSDLPLMLVDPSASHVVQAAMRSISNALLHHDRHAVWFKTFETTFAKVCKAVGEKATEVMCSRYGSHVLRDIISVLSGVSVDVFSKEVTGRSRTQLEGRLTVKAVSKNIVQLKHQGFPELLKSLATTILEACRETAAQLCADSAAGPVLQAILKALSGEKELVTFAIATIMGCWKDNAAREGKVLENAHIEAITEMMKDRSSSHLMEVILQTAPDPLYVEIFQRFFRHHLLPLSLHQCANFAVQSLVASTRHEGQVNLVLDELEESFAPLIEERRAGVVSSILAACGRYRTRRREVCRALAHAINHDTSTLNVIVPRMLFLEDFASSRKTGSQWEPSFGKKMSVLGSAMLQMIFSFPQEFTQQFSTSFAALEADQVLATVKDVSGSHVLEAFILSCAPLKHKYRSISKLKGHFAELATNPVSSFTVEKCFSIADINLKEAITSELVSVQDDLTRSKHGPYLLKRFDVAGYAKQPGQWKQRQSSKQGSREAFAELFSSENSAKIEHEDSTPALEDASNPNDLPTIKCKNQRNATVDNEKVDATVDHLHHRNVSKNDSKVQMDRTHMQRQWESYDEESRVLTESMQGRTKASIEKIKVCPKPKLPEGKLKRKRSNVEELSSERNEPFLASTVQTQADVVEKRKKTKKRILED